MRQTLNLDKRQRAMLREMGARVWQPLATAPATVDEAAVALVAPVFKSPNLAGAAAAAAAHAPVHRELAMGSIAGNASVSSPKGTLPSQELPALPPLPPVAELPGDSRAASWSAGSAQALYAQATRAPGPRWLVLAETPAAAVHPDIPGSDSLFNPFEGDAGKLLDNMLRAVQLHKTGSVMLAPLVRRFGVDAAPDAGFPAALATLVEGAQPDVVLVMGRLAAQALLQSGEPFGKLRGQVHNLHGVQTIVTHDAAYLLRSPLEKAKAWEDLCLALSVL